MSRRILLSIAASVAWVACTDFASSKCTESTTCPSDRVCEPLANRCVLPEQLDACGEASDGADCEYLGFGGSCDRGVCVAALCGDGIVAGAELCDGDVAQVCSDFGFDRGYTRCTATCDIDASRCGEIGWDVVGVPVAKGFFFSAWVSPDGTLFAGFREISAYGGEFTRRIFELSETASTIHDVPAYRLWGRSATEVYATTEGGLLRFDGATWDRIHDAVYSTSFHELWGDEDILFARELVDGSPTVMSFDGETWTTESEPYVPSIRYRDFYYALGDANDLWRRSDAGEWTQVVSAPGTGQGALHVSGDEVILIRSASGASEIFRGAGSPLVWEPGSIALDYDVTGSWVSASNQLFTAGPSGIFDMVGVARVAGPDWGTLIRGPSVTGYGNTPFLVGGAAIARSTGTHSVFSREVTSGDSILWAASDEFVISGGLLAGQTFYGSLASQSFLGSLYCGAWGRSETDALMVGSAGILHFGGPGVGFVSVTAPPFEFSSISCPMWADDSHYWLGGRSGSLYSFDLSTWTDHSIDTSGDIVALSGSGPSQVYALVDADGRVDEDTAAEVDRLYRYENDEWTEVYSDSGLRDVWATDQAVVVVGARSVRFDGQEWQPLVLPANIDTTLISVHGSDAADVAAISNRGELIYFDGTAWGQVGTSFFGAKRVFVTAGAIFLGAFDSMSAIARLEAW